MNPIDVPLCDPLVALQPRRAKPRLGHPASYIDKPVLLIDRTAAGSVAAGTDERFYYHRNQQYSITALTDNTGTPVERYAYTAYGDPTLLDGAGTTPRTSSFINNPYTYTARAYDSESGLMYFRKRMYETRKARFLSHDPIRYPDGPNTYCDWFSPRHVDPSGTQETLPPIVIDFELIPGIDHRDDQINCAGYGFRKKSYCGPTGSLAEFTDRLGYECSKGKGVAAGDCKAHCKKCETDSYTMMYVYVYQTDGVDTQKVKDSCKGKDVLKDDINLSDGENRVGGYIDIHCLRGGGGDVCTYTYQPSGCLKENKEKNKTLVGGVPFTPSSEIPEYDFKNPNSIIEKYCCCKKSAK